MEAGRSFSEAKRESIVDRDRNVVRDQKLSDNLIERQTENLEQTTKLVVRLREFRNQLHGTMTEKDNGRDPKNMPEPVPIGVHAQMQRLATKSVAALEEAHQLLNEIERF